MVVLINFLLFLVFTVLILLFISHNKISSLTLSIIIYIVYSISTGTYTIISTTPIISIFITAVVISLVSTTTVQIMNRL